MPAKAPGEHPNDDTDEDLDRELDEELAGLEPADPVLIAAVRRGDADAAAELFRRHRPGAIRFASMTASQSLVEDIVSEAFERVFAALYQGRGPDSFRPYLFTTIRRVKVDMHRRQSREVAADVSPGAPPRSLVAEDGVGATLDAAIVRRAFQSLPERWRLVLWYMAVESRTLQETADLLDLNQNAVAVLGFRAREGLRNAYLAQHVSEQEVGAHRQVLDLLPRWVRGGLPASKRMVVDEHLPTCATCSGVADELASINTSLGGAIGPLLLGFGMTGPSLIVGVGTAVGSTTQLVTRAGSSLWRLALAASVTTLLVAGGVVVLASGHDSDPRPVPPAPSTTPALVVPGDTLQPVPHRAPHTTPQVSPTPRARPTEGSPTPTPTPTSTAPTSAVTTSIVPVLPVDVGLGSVSSAPIGTTSWRHVTVPVRGRGPVLVLEATLHGVTDQRVHTGRDFGAWVCAEEPLSAGALVLSCRLPAWEARQDLAIDVLPGLGAALMTLAVRPVGVPDPDVTNNNARFVLPST